jgi:ABC-type nickel/cobalt efflux system permease component RcnA
VTPPASLLFTALVLGAQHSFGPDHIAAVGLFVSRSPSWKRALGLGIRWGIGHSTTILLLGGALALSGLRLPPRFGPAMERVVGATLIALGVLAAVRATRLHGHWHEHDGVQHWHLHTHHTSAGHDHDHRTLLGLGMVHGLAGTGALVLMIPVAMAATPHRALLFLATFGLGTVLSMALFSAVAGGVLARMGHASLAFARGAALLAAAGSVTIGLWWLLVGGA